jgi:large conductance mechanosensitive channel
VTQLVREFKDFIARGNVVDLAVGVVIGVAFSAVINSFVDDILNAIIGAVVGKPNFNDLTFEIGDGVVRYGRFITALVNFLIIGLVLFLVVRTINRLQPPKTPEAAETTEKDVLLEIRDLLANPPKT